MTSISNAQLLESIQSLHRELDDRFTLLTAETNQLRTQLTILTKTVDHLSTLSQESHRTLRGSNGNPGIVANLVETRNQITDLENHIKNCSIHSVTATLHGSDKDPGLIERLRRLEDLDRSLRKWIYLALSSLLLGLLSLLFDLLPRVINLL